MGGGRYGNFGNTIGSRQPLENDTNIVDSTESLIQEMKDKNFKFSEEEIEFVTRDKTGQIVWLEKGNSSAGLEHIISRHEKDFLQKHNVTKSEIKKHLENVYSHGNVEYGRLIIINGKQKCEKLYKYKDSYYLLSGIGTNGFIVSGYPISSVEAQKLIKRWKNEQ